MITIFNREELFITYDMNVQSKVRTVLADKNIKYDVKVVNQNSPALSARSSNRVRCGTLGENLSLSREYIFYVKKEDYDEACYALSFMEF